MIQIARLEGFYRVALAEGYARAAREYPYPITQPAVHQQVRKLERELGVVLFERVSKARVVLTVAGRTLFEFIAPFFEGLPAVEHSLRTGKHGGTLRIDAAELILRRLMPRWLQRLQRTRPDIRIELSEVERLDVARLRNHETDLIVDYFTDVPSGIETVKVAEARAFLVVPATHPLAGRRRLSLRDLESEAFISYSPGLLPFDMQMQLLARHGIEPRRSFSATTAETILGFVESGLGFSVVPSLDTQGPKGRGFTAFPLKDRGTRFSILAAWRQGSDNPLLKAALDVAPSA